MDGCQKEYQIKDNKFNFQIKDRKLDSEMKVWIPMNKNKINVETKKYDLELIFLN